MRCVACGSDKRGADFSGAQKKKPATQRKCTSCTAAANTSGVVGVVGVAAVQLAGASKVGTTLATTATAGGRCISTAAADKRRHAPITSCGRHQQACSSCGELRVGVGTLANHQWKQCARCKQAFYCSRDCQLEHWKRGGHKRECTKPLPCTICLDAWSHPLPMQGGCGCRGASGCAHLACRIETAEQHGQPTSNSRQILTSRPLFFQNSVRNPIRSRRFTPYVLYGKKIILKCAKIALVKQKPSGLENTCKNNFI